jgi:uroporphyrinogen-III synthase
VRIVVTRAARQAEELARLLRERGAIVILVPVIEIVPPLDDAPLREAAAQCDSYDWILFTSANAVSAFAAELPAPRGETKARIAVIGSATREAAERNGFRVSLVPRKYVAEALCDAFAQEYLNGKRVLIPSAAVTRDIVPTALRNLGAQVDVVEAYRNVVPADAELRASEIFREPFPGWVTFASSSAVNNLVALVGTGALSRVKIAAIGPVTSETVRKHGLGIAAEARVQTADGLVQAMLEAE